MLKAKPWPMHQKPHLIFACESLSFDCAHASTSSCAARRNGGASVATFKYLHSRGQHRNEAAHPPRPTWSVPLIHLPGVAVEDLHTPVSWPAAAVNPCCRTAVNHLWPSINWLLVTKRQVLLFLAAHQGACHRFHVSSVVCTWNSGPWLFGLSSILLSNKQPPSFFHDRYPIVYFRGNKLLPLLSHSFPQGPLYGCPQAITVTPTPCRRTCSTRFFPSS